MTLTDKIRMYEIEVLKGADTIETLKYWGPSDPDDLPEETYLEGLHLVAYSWDDED